MGLIKFIKRKEIAEINRLNKELQKAQNNISALEFNVSSLESDIASLSQYHSLLQSEKEIKTMQNDYELQKIELRQKQEAVEKKMQDYDIMIQRRKKLITELDDKILIQDFNLYNPIYDFDTSEEYKEEMNTIKEEQAEMIKAGTAATCSITWELNGSRAQGKAITRDNIKQILRCFNDECDMLVSKVKFNNVGAFQDKMIKSWKALNRMNKRNAISISDEYLDLKMQELELAYEYAQKKEDEKEERRRIREQLREEAKLQKEIEEARKNIFKEQKHYSNALEHINNQLNECSDENRQSLLEKKQEIESHLSDLDVKIKDIDYREANKRAGYVYIISNIGSFGEGIYKIGMTRRLDPMERVDELGDASVPFKFDVHALIFSDNAPKLEAALHKAFIRNKVNMVNNRREFFKVPLDEIEKVVKENYDKTVEFKRIPEAQQYRESLKILENPDAYPELFRYKEYRDTPLDSLPFDEDDTTFPNPVQANQ